MAENPVVDNLPLTQPSALLRPAIGLVVQHKNLSVLPSNHRVKLIPFTFQINFYSVDLLNCSSQYNIVSVIVSLRPVG